MKRRQVFAPGDRVLTRWGAAIVCDVVGDKVRVRHDGDTSTANGHWFHESEIEPA